LYITCCCDRGYYGIILRRTGGEGDILGIKYPLSAPYVQRRYMVFALPELPPREEEGFSLKKRGGP
jgi:hypothetical protein